jgi:GR25 family glycosyltransferase involved in LPS biosynthesis
MTDERALKWRPEEAWVISLDRRPDRWQSFVAQTCHLDFGVVAFPAVDGQVVRPPAKWRASTGAWGCACSHRAVLAQVHGTTLILEDDVVIPADFQQRMADFYLQVPDDWLVLKIGGQHHASPWPVARGVGRCRGTIRTHAYVVRKEGAEKLIELIDGADSHWDGPFGFPLDALGRCYAPDPFLVQLTSSGSDTD